MTAVVKLARVIDSALLDAADVRPAGPKAGGRALTSASGALARRLDLVRLISATTMLGALATSPRSASTGRFLIGLMADVMERIALAFRGE